MLPTAAVDVVRAGWLTGSDWHNESIDRGRFAGQIAVPVGDRRVRRVR